MALPIPLPADVRGHRVFGIVGPSTPPSDSSAASLSIPDVLRRSTGSPNRPTCVQKITAVSATPFVIDTAVVFGIADTTRHLYAFNANAAMLSDLTQKLTAGVWTDRSRDSYTYDERNRMTGSATEHLIKGSLTLSRRYTYVTDAMGNLISELEEMRDTLTNTLKPSYRITCLYDQRGKILLSQYENVSTGRTTGGGRSTYVRDAAGNELLNFYERWDNGWSPSHRTTTTRDDHGRPLSEVRERRESGYWIPTDRTGHTYDARGNALTLSRDDWLNGEWQIQSRETSTYDAQNNIVLWIFDYGVGGKIYSRTRYTYEYADGRETGGMGESWPENSWEPRYRWTIEYDSRGDRTARTIQQWVNDTWSMTERRSYTYDTERRMTGETIDRWWDGQLQVTDRTTWAFDAEGDPTLSQYESCDSLGRTTYGYRWLAEFGPGSVPTVLAHDAWSDGTWQPAENMWTLQDSVSILVPDRDGNSSHNSYRLEGCRVELHARAIGADPDHPPTIDLFQNFPNPFNPNSDIRYLISEFSSVRLSVYDILGREVAVLVNEPQAPGMHQVRFNATGLPSGAYFYRLQVRPSDSVLGRDSRDGAGSLTATKKMLLIR